MSFSGIKLENHLCEFKFDLHFDKLGSLKKLCCCCGGSSDDEEETPVTVHEDGKVKYPASPTRERNEKSIELVERIVRERFTTKEGHVYESCIREVEAHAGINLHEERKTGKYLTLRKIKRIETGIQEVAKRYSQESTPRDNFIE